MQVVGYIRVSTEEQDLDKHEHLLLKYAQQHDMHIDDFIQVEISSRRNTRERRIDKLLARLRDGDVLLVAALSRLGRNMFEVINLINQLSANGVKIIFVRQPELSTAGPHGKLLLAIYSYFAEVEREFISMWNLAGIGGCAGAGQTTGAAQGQPGQGAGAGCTSGADQGILEPQNPAMAHSFDSQPTIGSTDQLSGLPLFCAPRSRVA